jgi:hypothetical protein
MASGDLSRVEGAGDWRYPDGTFMPNQKINALIEEIELEEYERSAAGGRARAARARRAADDRFLPTGSGLA